MKTENFIEMLILVMEIILLFSFSLLIFNKFNYSFEYYSITLFSTLITLWRMYNFGKPKNSDDETKNSEGKKDG